jgi:hypothetical protein
LVALEQPGEATYAFVVDAKALVEKPPGLFKGGNLTPFHLFFEGSQSFLGYALLLATRTPDLHKSLKAPLLVGFPPAPKLAAAVAEHFGEPEPAFVVSTFEQPEHLHSILQWRTTQALF